LLINYFSYGELITSLEIVGFVLGLVGAFFITSGDFIYDRLFNKDVEEKEIELIE